MPDITMCITHDCPLAKECYRYAAVPKEVGQSYATFQYEIDESWGHQETRCEYYIPLEWKQG